MQYVKQNHHDYCDWSYLEIIIYRVSITSGTTEEVRHGQKGINLKITWAHSSTLENELAVAPRTYSHIPYFVDFIILTETDRAIAPLERPLERGDTIINWKLWPFNARPSVVSNCSAKGQECKSGTQQCNLLPISDDLIDPVVPPLVVQQKLPRIQTTKHALSVNWTHP